MSLCRYVRIPFFRSLVRSLVISFCMCRFAGSVFLSLRSYVFRDYVSYFVMYVVTFSSTCVCLFVRHVVSSFGICSLWIHAVV